MIHKKLLTAMLKKDFKLFLCLLLLDLLIMPFVYVNFPTMMDDASLLFNFYFIYLLLLIIILVQRQLGFTMKREEKIHDYQLPLTKRSLILTRLTAGILIFLIPYLIAWLVMGVFLFGRCATVISIWTGTVDLSLFLRLGISAQPQIISGTADDRRLDAGSGLYRFGVCGYYAENGHISLSTQGILYSAA